MKEIKKAKDMSIDIELAALKKSKGLCVDVIESGKNLDDIFIDNPRRVNVFLCDEEMNPVHAFSSGVKKIKRIIDEAGLDESGVYFVCKAGELSGFCRVSNNIEQIKDIIAQG